MELSQLFMMKYELLAKLESELENARLSADEKEVYRKGFEKALNAFFVESMNEILDQDKKAA